MADKAKGVSRLQSVIYGCLKQSAFDANHFHKKKQKTLMFSSSNFLFSFFYLPFFFLVYRMVIFVADNCVRPALPMSCTFATLIWEYFCMVWYCFTRSLHGTAWSWHRLASFADMTVECLFFYYFFFIFSKSGMNVRYLFYNI